MSAAKIPVAILGATGVVGQTLAAMLAEHPWFRLTALCASERSAGKQYGEAIGSRWAAPFPPPEKLLKQKLLGPEPVQDVAVLFSAVDAATARSWEVRWAKAGSLVCSNASAFRMEKDVPLIIPEVNPDHLALLQRQLWSGGIITNPNCSTTGLVLALAPLHRAVGLRTVSVSTLQAVSGAGWRGLSALAMLDTCLPWIQGEEEKLQNEPLRLLGQADEPVDIQISAACHRVPVRHGHLLDIAVSLPSPLSPREAERLFTGFRGAVEGLPSLPAQPLHLCSGEDRPQQGLDVMRNGGMAVSIGRVRRDTVHDLRFSALVHNLVRGAAGAAIANAELAISRSAGIGAENREAGISVI